MAPRTSANQMAAVSISLPEEVLEKLRSTKRKHQPLSQYICELVTEAMELNERKKVAIRIESIEDGN